MRAYSWNKNPEGPAGDCSSSPGARGERGEKEKDAEQRLLPVQVSESEVTVVSVRKKKKQTFHGRMNKKKMRREIIIMRRPRKNYITSQPEML